MPILNYTTKIEASKTVLEIQAILVKARAFSVTVNYDEKGQPVSLFFAVEVFDNLVPFRLPTDWPGVLAAMRNDKNVPPRYRNEEQARRVAWRIVKDWVEAQMAFIESGQVTLAQLFLPHAVKPDGRTFYEEIESSYLMLGSGEGDK
jgi:hypothetical protein